MGNKLYASSLMGQVEPKLLRLLQRGPLHCTIVSCSCKARACVSYLDLTEWRNISTRRGCLGLPSFLIDRISATMDMEEGRFAEELYAESLQLSKLELGPTGVDDQKHKLHDCDGDDLSLDGSLWDDSDDKLDNSSDLDREWQRRHDQFHTIGYREGLIAGKEASAQEGFNVGFKQSVLAGYSWGAVRGVTSAFAFLPDELKEKLIETKEKRNEFQGLYESVHSLSTTDALRLFNEDIKAKEASEQSENAEATPHPASLQEQTSHVSQLGNYHGQLEALIRESPAIDIHLPEPNFTK